MRHPKTYGRLISVLSAVQLVLALGPVAPAFQEQKPASVEEMKQARLTQTAFIYQGQLKDAIGPVNGVYDIQFTLYSAQTGGDVLGVNEMKDVTLTNGMFSFRLDFGQAAVEVKESWLEISVRLSGSAEAYTVLFPRQKLTPTPYAIFAQHEQWSLIGVPVGFADRALIAETETVEIETDLVKQSKHKDKKAEVTPGEKTTEAVAAAGTANYIAKFDGAGNPTANSLMFDNGTNVGIGTTAPSHRLSIAGGPIWTSNGWSGAVELENASAIAWKANAAGQRFGLGHTGGGFFVFRTASNPGTAASAALYDFTINDVGNVGIGTTFPTSKVEIAAQDGLKISGYQPFLTLQDANANNRRGYIQGVDGHLVFIPHSFAGGGAAMVMRSETGNVGIGTSTPLQKLHVVGNFIRVDGAGNEQVYLGGDGAGSDVQLGSLNPNITTVALYNGATGRYMSLYTSVLYITGGSDLAEPFEVSGAEAIEPGMVVTIDPDEPGRLRLADTAYDPRVAGIVSGANGINPGLMMKQEGTVADGSLPVSLTGRVYCWADASHGSIRPGDLLTTSSMPGHAMKVKNYKKAQGAIIGKAMTGLKSGTGLVLVLVTLQ
jgi:hypothetical protein